VNSSGALRISETIASLLGLYRPDVAVISFGAYAAGLAFSGGSRPADLPVGLAISLGSFNYIYSLNSIEDRHVDSVNKPKRPLPAGKLPVGVAQRYVTALLVLSVLYPLLVRTDAVNLALYLLLPLLGWAYSRPPLHLKTKLVPAAVSIACMYTTPVAIGLTSRLDVLSRSQFALLNSPCWAMSFFFA
jgi:4-hydroxybenzoate polyprenyltransferase